MEPPQFPPNLPPPVSLGLIDTINRPVPVAYPVGWEPEPLPDGTVRLRRTFGGRLLRDAQFPLILFSAAFFMGVHALPGRYGISSLAVLWGSLAVLLLLGAIAVLVWAFASHEELVAGQNGLTHRQTLGRYERTWRITGQATLRVQTRTTGSEWSRYGTQTARSLYVEQSGVRQIIDRRTAENTRFGMPPQSLSGLLSEALSGGGHESDTAALLARYLSAQTGWSVLDDRATGLHI